MKIILFVMNAPVHSEELPTTNPVFVKHHSMSKKNTFNMFEYTAL